MGEILKADLDEIRSLGAQLKVKADELAQVAAPAKTSADAVVMPDAGFDDLLGRPVGNSPTSGEILDWLASDEASRSSNNQWSTRIYG